MPATIRDVYRQFNPIEPLEADDDRYVETTEVRGRRSLFTTLEMPLADERASLLFTGLLGDGKTTLLKRLAKRLDGDGYLVAYGEADRRLNLEDVESEDVILSILGVVEQALRKRYGRQIEVGPLKRSWESLFRILNREFELPKLDVSFGPLGSISMEVKDAAGVRKEIRSRLRNASGPTFMQVANEYLDRARSIAEENDHRQLVVILDGLDKMKPQIVDQATQEERLFLGQTSDLLALDCHVIYTISLGLALKEGPNLGARFGQRPTIVPMVPVTRRNSSPHKEGMAKLREIVERRLRKAGTVLEEAFDEVETVARLCRFSGGYLRDLMTLVREACAEALAAHPNLPLTRQDVEEAIANFGAAQCEAAEPHLDALRHVAETHRFTDLDQEIQLALLKNRLVYAYFDESYWYDVCLSVREHLLGTGG